MASMKVWGALRTRRLDGRLMVICHLPSALLMRAGRRVCPCLLVCYALRWSAFHYLLSGSVPCTISLSLSRSHSHILARPLTILTFRRTGLCKDFHQMRSHVLLLSRAAWRRTMFWKQSGVISVYVTRTWKTSEDPCFIWFNSGWWEHAPCQSAKRVQSARHNASSEPGGLSRLAFTSTKWCFMPIDDAMCDRLNVRTHTGS